MILEIGGKFYKTETSQKEISETEFLREKIKELEGKIEELQRQPTIISYPTICPCPCPKTEPLPIAQPLTPGPWYYDPYTPTFTCNTGSR
jgi:hypothetical protein